MSETHRIAVVASGKYAIQEKVSGKWETRAGRFETPEAARAELVRRLTAALAAANDALPVVDAPKRRRPRGTGSLFQRADGMWVGRIHLGYRADGRQDREVVYAATEIEAATKLRALQEKIRTGEHRRSPRSTFKVETYLLEWLATEKRKDAPGTYDSKHYAVHNQILPFLKARPLAELSHKDIDRWLVDMAEYKPEPIPKGVKLKPGQHRNPKPWSTRTRQKAFDVLKDALNDALKRKLVSENVCEVLDRPEASSKTRPALSSAEAKLLLKKATEAGDDLVSLWWFMLLTGQRPGECLGLEWDRVELERVEVDDDGNERTVGRVDVSYQLQWLPYKEGVTDDNDPDRFEVPEAWIVRPVWQHACLTKLKTDKPKILPLPEPVRRALLIHRDAAPVSPHGLVWTRTAAMVRNRRDVGLPIEDERLLDLLRAAIKRLGLPDPANATTGTWDAHSMRHTAGTLLQELGVPADVRMAIMGHSTAAAHAAYMHKDIVPMTKAMAGLGELLSSD